MLSMLARLILWTSAAGLGLVLVACKTGEGCDPGQACTCTGGTDCFLGCPGGGCAQDCHGLGGMCGTVCDHDCSSVCHDVPDCTFSCGSGCTLDCHNVSSCGAICGDGCQYSCDNVSRCGVRVGAAGAVLCTSVTSCDVECTGACRVTCDNVSSCNVTCLGGGAPITCADMMTHACGAC
jgi:hypothetical protein